MQRNSKRCLQERWNYSNKHNKTMTTKEIIITVLAIWLILDIVCFVAWAMSGQFPDGNLYFGTITTHILRLIF